MRFTIALSALFLASFGSALPTANVDGNVTPLAENELVARAATITAVNCEGTHHSKDKVKKSYKAAKKHLKSDGKVKDTVNGYPKYYGNSASLNFKDCKNVKHLDEWPLGSDNGADRVVLGYTGNSFEYCGVMTHRNRSENDFKLCTEASD